MIITLIAIALLVTGISFLVYYNIKRYCSEGFFVAGIIILTVAIFVSLATGAFIIAANVNRDVDYQNKLHEREMLEYRIDHMGDDIVGNEMLYNDIVEFNNSLRSIKKWANNPWVNWFYVQDIATIDYIEIPEFEGSQYD